MISLSQPATDKTKQAEISPPLIFPFAADMIAPIQASLITNHFTFFIYFFSPLPIFLEKPLQTMNQEKKRRKTQKELTHLVRVVS